ncbi:MAG: glycoside hydrolase family 127 protein, partial [Bacteroidota bacterium]|nr:glycoside hydrolase family 127 protein [Bacteroidota bacterium]
FSHLLTSVDSSLEETKSIWSNISYWPFKIFRTTNSLSAFDSSPYDDHERIKKQMDRMMFELIHSQLDNGYLGTYVPSEYWTSWDVWSHKYNLYGLLAYYTTTGYQPALEACKRMGDLLCSTFGNGPGQRDIILAGEHMGMAATSVLDPMVELYKYTGDKKYLDFCYYILDAWEHANGPKIISALLSTGKVTKVGNGKAYEMLSNLVGLTKLYRVTGDEKLLKPVLIAWQDIVANRLYITGTTSSMEYFQDDDVLPAAAKDHIGEGCVTVTWIQLNQSLLSITGDVKYLEEIEKSVYNHLLAAENPQTGCVSYYTPLMDKKPYSCDITCCTSSVPRGIAMIPYFTFGKVNNIPTLMLYENALYKETITTADKKNIDVSLKVETGFPEHGNVLIFVNTSADAAFPIALRIPSWCENFIAKVGDEEFKSVSNQYLTIDRVWKAGDKIKISFDIPLKELSGGKSYPDQIAFKRGPQVLAYDSDLNTKVLLKRWIGTQVYDVILKNEMKQKIVVVPFADAGQTSADVKVWLPLFQTLK